MKKIFKITFMLLVMILHQSLNVYAQDSEEEITKPMVMIQNNNNLDYLNYEGYNIIATNLKENIPGNYTIKYQNNFTSEILVKNVIVISDSNFHNNFTQVNILNEFLFFDEKIYLTKKVKENEFIIVTKIEQIVDEETCFDFNMYYVKNGNIEWETNLMRECYGMVNKIVVENDLIYVLAQEYFPLSGLDISFNIYDLQGKLKKCNYYSGLGTDNITDFVIDDAYYLFGYSTSKTGDIIVKNQGEDGYILKVNKETFRFEETYDLGTEYNDRILEAYLIKNNFYIIQSYVYDNSVPSIKIVKVNKNGKILEEKRIIGGYGQTYKYSYVDNDCLFVTITEGEKTETIKYDLDLKETIIDNFVHDQKLNLLTCVIKNNYIYYVYLEVNNDEAYMLRIFDMSIQEEYCRNTFYLSDVDHIILNDDLTINTSYYEMMNEYKIYTIEKETNENYDICLNQVIYEFSTKSIYQVDLLNFGNYETLFYYEADNIDFVYYKNIKVDSNVSIENNETYDINLQINFKGSGNLNGQKILSGYVISTPGEYTLELLGKDDIKEIYVFTVEEISQKIEEENATSIKNPIKSEISIEQTTTKNQLSINYENEKKEGSVNPILWPLVIPCSLAMICIIIGLKGAMK